jgi:hypothetical protein
MPTHSKLAASKPILLTDEGKGKTRAVDTIITKKRMKSAARSTMTAEIELVKLTSSAFAKK